MAGAASRASMGGEAPTKGFEALSAGMASAATSSRAGAGKSKKKKGGRVTLPNNAKLGRSGISPRSDSEQ